MARCSEWLDHLLRDVLYACRSLRKSPGFSTAAVLTLALGIGANTAIFSIVQSVVLAPLPYAEPDRLAMVWENNPRFPRVFISYPNFRDWQRNARSFEQMAAARWQGSDLTSPGTPEHLDRAEISSDFFRTLGVKLALGREFSPQEDQHGGAPVVIISDHLWSSRFNRNPGALGKSLTLDGTNYTIIGAAPPRFHFFSNADVYTPLGQTDPLIINNRGSHDGMLSIVRLKPEVSLSQAQAEMSTIQSRLDHLYPDDDRDIGTDVLSLKQQIVGNTGPTLLLVLGAVMLVLLIACANVANLLLARSTARVREFAIRSALGANRARLVRQLLTESVLLALAGGGFGLLIALCALRPLLAVVPAGLPRSESIAVNAPVLLFTLGISIFVGLLFGLAPALQSSKIDLDASLKEGSRGSTSAHHRAQSTLVIVQMALTLVLLVGSGLLFRTIQHLWESNAGFDIQHVITFKVGVSHSLLKTAASTRTAYQQLLERIGKIPGVQAADFTWLVPLSGGSATMPFWIGSQKPASLQAAPRMLVFLTGPDYLRAMGIPLLRGRFFTPQDTTKSPCVIVVDSDFANKYFPGTDPIGQSITAGFSSVGPCPVVGVVGHVKHWGMDEHSTYTKAQAYFSLYQDPDQWVPINYPSTTIIVRTPLEPGALMPAIRTAVHGTVGTQPVYNVETMQQLVSESMSSQRFPMIMLAAFAGLALLLASLGIYGVISYSVSRRVQEIGIRMALGAEKGNVLWMVLGRGLQLVLAGIAIGAVAALTVARLLSSFSQLLYGVREWDPLTLTTVSLVLIGTALLACYIPARHAAQLDPIIALRHE